VEASINHPGCNCLTPQTELKKRRSGSAPQCNMRGCSFVSFNAQLQLLYLLDVEDFFFPRALLVYLSVILPQFIPCYCTSSYSDPSDGSLQRSQWHGWGDVSLLKEEGFQGKQ
jgi:hypothetical protein